MNIELLLLVRELDLGQAVKYMKLTNKELDRAIFAVIKQQGIVDYEIIRQNLLKKDTMVTRTQITDSLQRLCSKLQQNDAK